MSLNDYDAKLSSVFRKTDTKPDKQFVFLPTVLSILNDLKNKTVLDLGCGDGFFTKALAEAGAKLVIGIDNSEEQLKLAESQPHPSNIEYRFGNIFKDALPPADIILSPFVVNYSESISNVEFLFKNIFNSLSSGSKVLFVVDLPTGKDLKKFGSVKTLLGQPVDETKIQIELFDKEELICTLYSNYYIPETLEKTLTGVGFKNISWHKPIISEEGIKKFGKNFWSGFLDETELGYLSAEKI